MKRICLVAMLWITGCSQAPPPPTPSIARLPPVTTDEDAVSAPAPRGRIALAKPADTPAERQALQSVTRWLDEKATKPYDVELSIHVRDGQPTTVFVVYAGGRDEQDRPLYYPGGHCSLTLDGDGNVANVIGGL
jgi:hypothetical protein